MAITPSGKISIDECSRLMRAGIWAPCEELNIRSPVIRIAVDDSDVKQQIYPPNLAGHVGLDDESLRRAGG
ncbi:MAG: hypothetical protein DWI22_15465 [Planctomycetota bacterium]|nr:MAG: hypothetical protein DWI22_15465 [Planctomycetota bacterium]